MWQLLIEDISHYFENKSITLVDAYLFVKSLYILDLSGEENFNQIVNYLVDRGYDADDYNEILGVKSGLNLIYRIVKMNPKLTNNNFIVHIQDFIERNIEQFGKG